MRLSVSGNPKALALITRDKLRGSDPYDDDEDDVPKWKPKAEVPTVASGRIRRRSIR